MIKFSFYSLVLSMLMFSVTNAQAQNLYKLKTDKSSMVVVGTSTVHDWEVKATDLNAETALQFSENSISEISHIKFISPVTSLKSGKKLMDSKTHEALKANKFPEIKFTLKNPESIKLSKEKAVVTGLLTIAGKTKEISLDVNFDIQNREKIEVSGEVPLKMSEFNIEPPTAMMGTIKTGDEVLIKFNLEFQQTNEAYTRNF